MTASPAQPTIGELLDAMEAATYDSFNNLQPGFDKARAAVESRFEELTGDITVVGSLEFWKEQWRFACEALADSRAKTAELESKLAGFAALEEGRRTAWKVDRYAALEEAAREVIRCEGTWAKAGAMQKIEDALAGLSSDKPPQET